LFGESIEQRNSGKYLDYIIKQVDSAPKGLRKDKVDEIVFAYEPIWAIEPGETASLLNIIEVVSEVKKFIKSKPFYNEEKIKFVYGGSVTPNNSEEILNSNIINGALVGGASLDVEQFVKIIESIEL